MKKLHTLGLIAVFFSFTCYAQESEPELDSTQLQEFIEYFETLNNFQKEIDFQQGTIDLSNKVELNIPSGYFFIPKKETERIVFDFWGNPRRPDLLGMIVDTSFQLANSEDWAFILSEETEGYVEDEDAKDIDYDDLMDELQDVEADINEERIKMGYEPVHTVGWASSPYYDEEAKILHWAKELQFGTDNPEHTLNYDVRILGRNGLLSMNAVGDMNALEEIKTRIPDIIHVAKFKEGHTYFDFDPSVDEVAAYTVGGLVAGKLLAKAGILGLLLKNIKLVIIGAIGLFSLLRKRIASLFGFGGSTEEEIEEE